MTSLRTKIILLLPLIWLVIIGGLIISKETTVRSGEDVILRTVPVDPRDLFRGDYVILRYEISNIGYNEVPFDTTAFTFNDPIYVHLVQRGRYAEAYRVSATIPSDTMYIKGRVTQANPSGLDIEYGIESYFVPEGEGKVIERARDGIDVKVTLDAQGNAVLKSVIVDGEEIDY